MKCAQVKTRPSTLFAEKSTKNAGKTTFNGNARNISFFLGAGLTMMKSAASDVKQISPAFGNIRKALRGLFSCPEKKRSTLSPFFSTNAFTVSGFALDRWMVIAQSSQALIFAALCSFLVGAHFFFLLIYAAMWAQRKSYEMIVV